MPSRAQTLQDWIAVPSITGAEADYADLLGRYLLSRGFAVERQEVAAGRFNLLARAGQPEVVFCTHLDTVPPFISPSEDGDFVRGRGSCDAKGPALAMIEAGAKLLAGGEDRIGFLFTVAEETDSLGAQIANARLAEPWRPRFTIVGEPTDNRFVSGHKGIFKARLVAEGVARHSSQPGGPSAIHELVHCLAHMLEEDWGVHADLGPGSLNVGEVAGGIAPNVVADQASATLLLRSVESPQVTEAKLRKHLSGHVHLDCLYKNYGPVEFHVPAGHEGTPVAFGTDAPHLGRWGTPLLYGPGRIVDAHTEHECISKRSLEAAIEVYAKTAGDLLARSGR
ncbi:MAG: M20/M25/M40 family metallo-hydrolase [Planctomycetota bacterium]